MPPKLDVLAWEADTAAAPARAASLWLRQPGNTSLSVVSFDVSDSSRPGKLLDQRLVPNVQPPMRGDSGESMAGLAAAMADPRVQAAVTARGLTMAEVTADYDSVGNYPGVVGTSPRQCAFEFYAAAGDNFYSRPLKLKAAVDLDSHQVLSVYDGHLAGDEVPPEAGGQMEVPVRDDPPKKFQISRPDGVSFTVDGNQVSWQRWQFHARTDWRVGVSVGMVRYNDTKASGESTVRSVAYELFLSEMFVPYQLDDQQWYYRTFLDAGEFGVGSDANELTAAECGGGEALYLDLHDVTLDGSLVTRKGIGCVFERWTGDPVWLHGEVCQPHQPCASKQTRAAVELVVRTVPRVGNYDYVVDTIFRLDGSIHFKVGATGIDAMKASTPHAARPGEMQHKAQMDQFRAAPYHDHIFNFRLDVDVDGQENELVLGKLEDYVPTGVPRPTMWGVQLEKASTESEGKRDLDDSIRHPEVWLVQNPESVHPATKNTAAFTLIPAGNLATLMQPTDPLAKRAAFTEHHLWTTPWSAAERFAAGDWPNQQPGGRDGLDIWTSANRSIANVDLVLWYTVGFHLSLIHISEPTRLLSISYAVFCLKKKKKKTITSESKIICINIYK
eukprot:TRINITY_DN2268_c0_g1_i5.p1 TRINITY_DN2268_c0_g1~~TRINITY_DN2268_c0_g1_i5.p1  ORF type:complete len:614 (-),score=145.21 TRINITY_DN2268_c0_g1_i5:17-1858(-)